MAAVRRILSRLRLEECGVCAFDSAHLLPCRAASRLPKGAKSVIVTLFPYAVESPLSRNLSRYACVPDYHRTAGEVLSVAASRVTEALGAPCEAFIDNSPLPEVACAVAAGLGVRGDNGLFISERYGSFVFIGCLVTPFELPSSEVGGGECPHCGACAAACPGGCLPGTGRETCLSAVTQKKGELTREERALVVKGGLAWGCDRCQEVCPLNRGKKIAPHPCFSWYRPRVDEESLGNMTLAAYGWRGEAPVRRNLRLLSAKEDRP